MPIVLPSLQVIELVGADAIAFAQAQFSSDVLAQANGHWQFSAWLSPQGRVRAFFHLLRDDDEHLRLILRGGDAREMTSALQRFVFRSKVELRVLDNVQVLGCTHAQVIADSCGEVATGTTIAGDIRHTNLSVPGDPSRWLLLCGTATDALTCTDPGLNSNQWLLADIRAGLPELTPALQDQLLPQWLGLDRLGAISVKKGCYPGQEIMARLHFKGGNKRGMYLVEFDGDCVPQADVPLAACDERHESAGRIVMAAHTATNRIVALATLHDELAKTRVRMVDPAGSEIEVLARFG